MMTIHVAKGLEFDHVFIIGAVMGITPSDKADTAVKLEEERRMFYVAMTRARKYLYFTVSRDKLESRFLLEAGLI